MDVKSILAKMSIEEKIDLCCGADFWHSVAFEKYGLPAITVADGPHGLRFQYGESDMLGIHNSVPATCFPTAAATGCSWDIDLLKEIGSAIAEEAQTNGVDAILGPGLNIKRSPLCGRNFEYFSEDPYLTGQLGAAFVLGIQENGVSACLKHFAANSQEYKRFSSNGHVDERTLREIYLSGFEKAVDLGKPSMIMSAYDKINGIYCSDNKWLLTDVLRDEWGFDGIVVTDWGGMHSRVAGFKSGCDWSMPGGGTTHLQRSALKAYQLGELSEHEINKCAKRMVNRILLATANRQCSKEFDKDAHYQMALKAATESAVLLKNDSILPLSVDSVAVIGYMAKNPRYQGSGSSHINPTKLTSLCDAVPDWFYAEGCDQLGNTNEYLLEQAKEAARKSKICVVVAGLPESYESEGFDRNDMKMPNGHIRMIDIVANVNPNTVVVLLCGSPVETPWIDKVKAVIYMGLPGQAGGEAIFDLLTGKANPSGKLPETWPLHYEDAPCAEYYGSPHRDAQYREGIYVGYRYYETATVPVRFPFGYGLSYTRFEYSDLYIEGMNVHVTIKNCGKVDGAEIAQLYVTPPKPGIHRPDKELRGFCKVFLKSGESKEVTFILNERSFAVWEDGWKVQKGKYEIKIASSVRDARLSQIIEINGIEVPVSHWQDGSWYASPKDYPPKEDFEKMLGHLVHAPEPLRKGNFTDENTIAEMAEYSFFVRIVKNAMIKAISKDNGGKPDYNNPTFRMTYASSVDAALFNLAISSCGAMPVNVAYGILEIANGHFFNGIRLLVKKDR